MRILTYALALALAAAAAGAVASASPSPSTGADPPAFGINAQFLLPSKAPSTWPPHLDAMARNGIAVVRSDANWEVAEPRPPTGDRRTFDWRSFDVTVAALAKRHLRWLPVVAYSAKWATSLPLVAHAPPANVRMYAGYAAALAARYGPNGAFWDAHPELDALPIDAVEIWNEPDVAAFWSPAPNPAGYADLYLAARAAVHDAGDGVEALVGGLVRDPSGFLRDMVRARPQLRDQLDAVGIHPYAASPEDVIERIVDLRLTLASLGLPGVPIDVTEVGWPTGGRSLYLPTVNDATRAEAYRQLVDRLSDSGCGVERVIPHTWVTAERNPLSAEDWYGIVHPDARPTQTATAYAQAIAKVRDGAESTSALPRCPSAPASELALGAGAGAWMGLVPTG